MLLTSKQKQRIGIITRAQHPQQPIRENHIRLYCSVVYSRRNDLVEQSRIQTVLYIIKRFVFSICLYIKNKTETRQLRKSARLNHTISETKTLGLVSENEKTLKSFIANQFVETRQRTFQENQM